ncbi:MAG TPA: response regulator [Opitutaceae bacterium]|nr:response regulator [Opitutaceae bacterium]
MQLLHLEDSPNDAELIGMLIRREWPDCQITHVACVEDYRAALARDGFDVILSDYTLPGFDGLGALALARQSCPSTPFLFLSGTIGEERAVEALKRGASDYIIKDRPTRLIPAIRQAFTLMEEGARRRRSEQALRQQEARLREQASLLDKARDAIVATDLEHRVAYWNASAERLYGLTAADVFGRRLDELGLGFDPARFAEAHAQVMAGGEWRGDFRLRNRAGETLLVESTWSLVIEEGRPRSILYIDTDVTERKKLETQLLRVQRMESIGTLAGGVAHDLNNVLTPILLSIELLEMKATSNEDRRLLEKTKASALHGAALVQQLLAFARGADGCHSKIDPLRALEELKPLARQSLPPTVVLAVRPEPRLWPMLADATQFNQVVLNLCINARDAMPQGGRIEIVAKNVTVDGALVRQNPGLSPGPHVLLSVTDTGSGIPAAILDKIFDPFFTTKVAGKGTGLGLSMVAGIMKSHGGLVEVESEDGRGTTFRLYFPAIPDAAAPVMVPVIAAGPARGAGEGILLIDDEPVVRETLQLVLQSAGYRVFPAPDGASGIAEFERHNGEIALVITDMMLPDQVGTQVVRALRTRRARLPVIAISGMMATGQFDELTRLNPPVNCLSKPLKPAALLTAVRTGLVAQIP